MFKRASCHLLHGLGFTSLKDSDFKRLKKTAHALRLSAVETFSGKSEIERQRRRDGHVTFTFVHPPPSLKLHRYYLTLTRPEVSLHIAGSWHRPSSAVPVILQFKRLLSSPKLVQVLTGRMITEYVCNLHVADTPLLCDQQPDFREYLSPSNPKTTRPSVI